MESQRGAVIFVLETSDHQEDFHVAADDDRQARDLDEDRDDGQNLPVHAEEARHDQRDAQRPERREHEFDTRDRDQNLVTQVKHERQNAFHRHGAHRQKRRTRARPAHEVRHQAHRAIRSEVALHFQDVLYDEARLHNGSDEEVGRRQAAQQRIGRVVQRASSTNCEQYQQVA